jgi:di/tricarboxylate transporter
MQWLLVLGLLVLGGINLSGRVAVEVAALSLLLILVGVGVVPAGQALSGFGSEAVWLVVGMMLVAEGIRRSGLLARAADLVTSFSGTSARRLNLGMTLFGAVAGAVLESTAAVLSLLPVVATTARRMKAEPAGIYASLALGSMAGGLLTLIGTSGNIVAEAILREQRAPLLHFFTLLPLGLGFLGIGLLYAFIPRRGDATAVGFFDVRDYVGEVRVPSDSPLAGKSLVELKGLADRGVTVLRILRNGEAVTAGPSAVVEAGDRLLVRAVAEDHLRWGDFPGLAPVHQPAAQADREQFLQEVREAVVPPGSPWVGRTARDLRLRQEGVELVAVWRQGATLSGSPSALPLMAGDMLLLSASPARLQELERLQFLVHVSASDAITVPGRGRLLALVPLAVFLGLALLTPLNLGLSALAGGVLSLILGRHRPEQVYRAVEWRVPLFIGALLPIAHAVSETGLAAQMAGLLARAVGGSVGLMVLGVYLMAAILTQVLSNIATAAVMTPVALAVGRALDVSPLGLVVAVLAALMMTPLTGTANKPALLVMARGALRHRDYLRWGLLPSLAGGTLAWVLVMTTWWPGRL